jgi:hypothetical protein
MMSSNEFRLTADNARLCLQTVADNGFVLTLPVLLWNGLLTRKLPGLFAAAVFHRDVPAAIRVPENIFRVLVLVLPGFTALGGVTEHRSGYLLYLAGLAVYFLSWLCLISFPQSRWSRSLTGVVAPALTPGFWLVGIGLVSSPYLEGWTWFRPVYFCGVFVFLAAHCLHVWFIHRRESSRQVAGRTSPDREV